jgi:hypothetical protein
MLPVVSGKMVSLVAIFRPHEFLVAKKDSEQASVDTPKEPQTGTSCDQVNPIRAIDISPFPTFCEKRQNTSLCGRLSQGVTSSLLKKIDEDAQKKNAVNKKEFQSRFQEKNLRNASGTERKLVYRQKNK